MKLILIALVLAAVSCSTLDSKSPASESLELSREDGSKIRIYLERNSLDGGSNTLLLYLQGSDCNSVVHDKFLQEHARAAWPSTDLLLIEKRGITSDLLYSSSAERPDCPAETILRDNPPQRVQDIKQVMEHIRQTQNYPRIVALGGSEGALIAAMFAAETGIPRAVVLINSGGRYFLDDVLHNIAATTPVEILDAEIKGFKGFVAHLLASEPFDLEMSNHGYSWWHTILSIDQQAVLQTIDAPVLIVQAGRDQAVSPQAVADMFENLRALGKSNIELVSYPDLDHGLADRDGNDAAAQVMTDIRKWLTTTLQ